MDRIKFCTIIPVSESTLQENLERCAKSLIDAMNYALRIDPGIEFFTTYVCADLSRNFPKIGQTEYAPFPEGSGKAEMLNSCLSRLGSDPDYYYTFVDPNCEVSLRFYKEVARKARLEDYFHPTLINVQLYEKVDNVLIERTYLNANRLTDEVHRDYPGNGPYLWGRFFRFPHPEYITDDLARVIRESPKGWGEDQPLLQTILKWTGKDPAFAALSEYYCPPREIKEINIQQAIRNIWVAMEMGDLNKIFRMTLTIQLFKDLNRYYAEPEQFEEFLSAVEDISTHGAFTDPTNRGLYENDLMSEYDLYALHVILGIEGISNRTRLPFLENEDESTTVFRFDI